MLDIVLAAPPDRHPTPAVPLVDARVDQDPPRARGATRCPTDVEILTDVDDRGLVVLGRDLDGRLKISGEVDHRYRQSGLGRALLGATLATIPREEPVFGQV